MAPKAHPRPLGGSCGLLRLAGAAAATQAADDGDFGVAARCAAPREYSTCSAPAHTASRPALLGCRPIVPRPYPDRLHAPIQVSEVETASLWPWGDVPVAATGAVVLCLKPFWTAASARFPPAGVAREVAAVGSYIKMVHGDLAAAMRVRSWAFARSRTCVIFCRAFPSRLRGRRARVLYH